MSRLLPDEMAGVELSPLCIVKKMSDAREVEAVLDAAGVQYTFEITPIVSNSFFRVIFGGIKKGVMFLVAKGELEHCRSLLNEAGHGDLTLE